MALEHLAGATYGPVFARIAPEKVAEYVAATGDQAERWREHAPPSYAGALLFALAPAFLESPEVRDHTAVLIHADQWFKWPGPLPLGATVQLDAFVDQIRSRGGIDFVTFRLEVVSGSKPILTSVSTFLLGAEASSQPPQEREEPPVHASAASSRPGVVGLPTAGEELPALVKSASRVDLVRYAGASGDFNPIHWDHDAARRAGLAGIVVHGLMMQAWLVQLASSFSRRPDPVAEMKARFRSPLYPSEEASAHGSVADVDAATAELRVALSSPRGDLVTATATIRRDEQSGVTA